MMAGQTLYKVFFMCIYTLGAWLSMKINITAHFNIDITLSLHLLAVASLAYELSLLTSS